MKNSVDPGEIINHEKVSSVSKRVSLYTTVVEVSAKKICTPGAERSSSCVRMAQSEAYLNGPHLQKDREGFHTRSGIASFILMLGEGWRVAPVTYSSLATTRVMSSSWVASPRKVCKVSMMAFWIASADSAPRLRMIWRRRSRPNISRSGLQVS